MGQPLYPKIQQEKPQMMYPPSPDAPFVAAPAPAPVPTPAAPQDPYPKIQHEKPQMMYAPAPPDTPFVAAPAPAPVPTPTPPVTTMYAPATALPMHAKNEGRGQCKPR